MEKIEDLEEEKPTTKTVVEVLHGYAEAMRAERKFPTALIAIRRALAIDPSIPNLWSTLGCTLWNMGKFEEAQFPMLQALKLEPENGANYGNLGLLSHSLREYGKAEGYFEKAIGFAKNEKDRLGAIWDRSLMYLELGEWERGLADYDSRIEIKGYPLYPGMPIPIWKGEPLDGKVLYIQAEQGIGDRILLSRYFSVIKERWPTCTIKACFNEKLADLFWEYRGLVDFHPHGVPWPDDLDYGIYHASLPRCLETRPNSIPSDPGLIRKRVDAALKNFNLPQPSLPSLKVGVAWTGNPEQTRNDLRSIPLEKLLVLAEDPRVTLYGFQVGPGQEDVGRLKAQELICDLGPGLGEHGLVLAGAAMMNMDIMVTVCTATAHLAGSLGVPCLTMLSWDPYWIWMQNDHKEKTPWYPNMKLIRQTSPGDWNSVISKVKDVLDRMIFEREIKIAA